MCIEYELYIIIPIYKLCYTGTYTLTYILNFNKFIRF